MTIALRSSTFAAACLLLAAAAGAQTGSTATPSQAPPGQSTDDSTRPATTTFFGDTGIWFVPTAEVLPSGKWSASAYRRGTNWIQGYTNVADFAGTFAVGIKDRAEIFGSFLFDTRIDRDLYPVFVNDPSFGGVIDRYPRVTQNWTGDNVGDFYLGAKINLWSESRQNPAAIAVRGMVKLPTGKKDVGVSTGKADGSIDLIISKEAAKLVEVSGYGGYEFRGSPDDFDAPTGAFRWGTGVTFPSRNVLRVFGELNGELPNKDTTTFRGVTAACVNCGVMPIISNTENLTRATFGFTAQAKNGFFGGVGVSWNVPTKGRNLSFTDTDEWGDYYDWQIRIGYHPGVKTYAPPPPAPVPPPPPPPVPPAHTLTVKADCNPCSVEIGKSSTVTATVQDSINCAVTYRWSAPTGTLAQPSERSTLWTAPQQDGTVPVTVTVTCPSDNKTASDTVNIQVTRPPVRTYTFEDVYFDFDRYSLRPEATRVLDEAIGAMRENPTLRIEVEGHTCNIGTAEYNLALGDRRANAVKDYLVSRGITADRLRTISYGEERPKYDNSREETRRLNRRAALTVNLR
jgi:outer membrane protein OmpA-like peptidoglycan-associated protein